MVTSGLSQVSCVLFLCQVSIHCNSSDVLIYYLRLRCIYPARAWWEKFLGEKECLRMKMRSSDEMKAENDQHSQNQTPNTHYFQAQSPKLELIMIQQCIVGYFHSVKEYLGVERKPSNRSAPVDWPIKAGLFKLEPNYKEPFQQQLSKLPAVLEQRCHLSFLIYKFIIIFKIVYSSHTRNQVLNKM